MSTRNVTNVQEHIYTGNEHVHVPYAKGGELPPGTNVVRNESGAPVAVMSAEQMLAVTEGFRKVRDVYTLQWDAMGRTFKLLRRILGTPTPPPPKTRSGMTARQYRAARRRYRQEMTAWKKKWELR